ncbi:MAG: protein translocase SEC61 complex subunit gamma [Candidatus Diapherotrites archaeon]
MGFRDFIESSKRVLTVSKKPDMQEYLLMIKITAIGVTIFGILGFTVALIFHYLGVTLIK